MKRNILTAVSGVPFVLAFGVPALLVSCVIGGVWVLAVLIKNKLQEKQNSDKNRE